jgi:hypothetical protein
LSGREVVDDAKNWRMLGKWPFPAFLRRPQREERRLTQPLHITPRSGLKPKLWKLQGTKFLLVAGGHLKGRFQHPEIVKEADVLTSFTKRQTE